MMRKKLLMMLVAMTMTVAAHAQFEEGKFYTSAALSNLDLNYSGNEKWHLDVAAKVGYFFATDWMVTAQAEYSYRKYQPNRFGLGAGLRYYIEENGLYIGAGANYVHHSHNVDDLMPTVQLGYAFFLSRTVTIEPELYYNQSLKNHSDYSGFGLRIGFGIYLE